MPDAVARGVLTVLLLGLIAWVLLANVGNLEDVGAALAEVSLQAALLLVVLLLVVQVLIAAQLAITVPGLGMPRGLVAVEGAAAVSNTVPGPSGTATRLGMLRSWGFYTDDFARSWRPRSSLTNLTVLVMPIFAVLIAAAEGEISMGIVVLAAIGLVVSAAGIVLVWLMLRSETFSRRVGTLTGRVARWARGVVHRRPSEQDLAEAAVRFRNDLRQTWSERRRPRAGRRARRLRPERHHARHLHEGRRPGHRRAPRRLHRRRLHARAAADDRQLRAAGGVGVTEALYVFGLPGGHRRLR